MLSSIQSLLQSCQITTTVCGRLNLIESTLMGHPVVCIEIPLLLASATIEYTIILLLIHFQFCYLANFNTYFCDRLKVWE